MMGSIANLLGLGHDAPMENPGNRPSVEQQLEQWFTYHPPQGDQQERYVALREAAKTYAEAIVRHVPQCADRTAALRKVREANWTANAAISCNGI